MIALSILLALAVVAIILLLVIVVAQRWAITDITQQEKRREELLKAEDTFAWIMRAKEYYKSNSRRSMSFCFQATRHPYHKFALREHIPEYNLDTFGIQEWWSSKDTVSWMDAFDTLAEIYKNKIKELCDGED